jgi:hypothetical protein
MSRMRDPSSHTQLALKHEPAGAVGLVAADEISLQAVADASALERLAQVHPQFCTTVGRATGGAAGFIERGSIGLPRAVGPPTGPVRTCHDRLTNAAPSRPVRCASFDHLVGAGEHGRRHVEFELRALQDR